MGTQDDQLGAWGLFRLFDITKPFPIRRLERLKGGAGLEIFVRSWRPDGPTRGIVVICHGVGARFASQPSTFAFGENQDAHGLAQTVRQDDHIAYLLIRLTRVKRGAQMNFHC